MNHAERSSLKCVVLFLALLYSGCTSKNVLPNDIVRAVGRIQTIPDGMKEGEVFRFLGLPKAKEPFAQEIAQPWAETCTRYRIGYGDSYILHCESVNPALKLSNLSRRMVLRYSDGELFRVQIMRQTKSKNGAPQFELIGQAWTPK